MPSRCLVQLETQAPANSTAFPIFAIHPIEGFVAALKPLAAKLCVPVYGLQCTEEAPLATLNDLAAFYIEQIKSVQESGPYVLVGYSFGASVAFEMASLLEKAGETASLVMIDGSPKYVDWFGKQSQVTDSRYEERGLAWFGFFVANLDYVKTINELNGIAMIQMKLQRTAELIGQRTKFPVDTVQTAVLSFYEKIRAARNYKPERKLTSSNVTLFKPTESYVKLPADYGLSEVKLKLKEYKSKNSEFSTNKNHIHFRRW